MKEIEMTEGVPTEDGWYILKVDFEGELLYYSMRMVSGRNTVDGIATILSYLKLPDL